MTLQVTKLLYKGMVGILNAPGVDVHIQFIQLIFLQLMKKLTDSMMITPLFSIILLCALLSGCCRYQY